MADTFDESLCATCETSGDFGGGGSTGGDTGGDDTGTEEPVVDTPGNSTYVSAVTIPGGIKVRWNYPETNPHAVAHVLLYRSASESLSNASVRTLLDGTEFIDWLDLSVPQTYYYWIRVVTSTGDPLPPVGPGIATHDPSLVEEDEGLTEVALKDLSQELQNLIGLIRPMSDLVNGEALSREEADDLLALSMESLEGRINTKIAAVEQRITEAESINTDMQTIANTLQAEFDMRLKTVALTQDEYDALGSYDPKILYVILDD